jgi:hypothetical protein
MYKSNNETILKLVAIKTKNKILISDNINGESYFHTKLGNYLYDGEKPNKTYHKIGMSLKPFLQKLKSNFRRGKLINDMN